MPCGDLRVLFRAPAGSRRGFGHLVRCRTLARALGVRPLVALRGSARAVDAALALGCDVLAHPTPRLLRALRPDLVVVDDPVARDAQRWIAASRRAGARVASVHDLGMGCLDADLVIDGSIAPGARARRRHAALVGPRYAMTPAAPGVPRRRPRRASACASRVLIALGGGPHAGVADQIARALVSAHRSVQVRIAAGFVARSRIDTPRVAWARPLDGLGRDLAWADVAITGGGVSLYEACAAAVPIVAIPVVRAQVPTVTAFARARAVRSVRYGSAPERVARQALELLSDHRVRASLARAAKSLVDGRGAARVARMLARLASESSDGTRQPQVTGERRGLPTRTARRGRGPVQTAGSTADCHEKRRRAPDIYRAVRPNRTERPANGTWCRERWRPRPAIRN
jgi:spore coat polysaccharide biosynthesis predicted glycosyltransferase SpsG